jgi:hypothetical protein
MKDLYLLLKMSDLDNFIIGKLKEETESEVVLDYPISIRLSPNAMGTTSVSTTKMMPFSRDNLVVVVKSNIVAMSPPNEKIIGYYLQFIEKYSKVYDEVLENDILGIRQEPPSIEDGLEFEDEEVTFTVPSGKNSVH